MMHQNALWSCQLYQEEPDYFSDVLSGSGATLKNQPKLIYCLIFMQKLNKWSKCSVLFDHDGKFKDIKKHPDLVEEYKLWKMFLGKVGGSRLV